MKKIVFVSLFIFITSLYLPVTPGMAERPLEISTAVIKFDRTEAIITVNYEFPGLMKLYILLLGSQSIEPKINSVFSEFDYEIIKMDQNTAILEVKNISRNIPGYYLHDTRKLGTRINRLLVYTPDSTRPKEFLNLNSTPNTFYRI